jgi:hypothetical protein
MGPPNRMLPKAVVLVIVGASVACSGGSPAVGVVHSPTPVSTLSSPSARATAVTSPVPVPPAYGLLTDAPNGANLYTVSLIGIDGKVVASAQASSPTAVSCGTAGAAVVPLPISTSGSRAYLMDAQGAIHFLAPNGDTGQATAVPAAAGRRSMFAVSADDRRIAVVVADFSSSGAATKLYVEDLNGGSNHVDTFSESGANTLWPVGWLGTDQLVLAVMPACNQAGSQPIGATAIHIVEAATADRIHTIGGPDCTPNIPTSLAGVVCQFPGGGMEVLAWNNTFSRPGYLPAEPKVPMYLSPDGSAIALSPSAGTATIEGRGYANLHMNVCGWIDSTHVLSGSDAQNQASVGDITNSNMVSVLAQGVCAGRIPNGL